MGRLRLYQVDFEPSDNFYIEDIESYLRTLSASAKRYEWNNLNYLKLGMNITIKLPLDQVHQIENTCNYAIIEQDNHPYYYFVVDAKWIAKRTIQLVLTLDTIQTFFTKLKWSDKTQVIRETQDRLVKLNNNYYLRRIDRYNEGFSPAKVEKVNQAQIKSAIGGKWYLVYMSNPAITQDNTSNPLFMGLLADTSLKIANAGTGTTDVEIPFSEGYIYYITTSGLGDGGYMRVGDKTSQLNHTYNNTISRVVAVRKESSTSLEIKTMFYTGDTYPYSFSSGTWVSSPSTGDLTKAIIHNARVIHKVPDTDYNRGITGLDKIDALPAIEVNAGSFPELKTTPYEDFDNSNSRLSKIIELPYPPVTVTKNTDNTYNFYGCTYNYGYNIMQVNIQNLSAFIKEDKRIQDLLYVTIANPTATDKPNIDLESKLYSSEFYDYAYYYDTDKQPIRLEDINTNMLNCSINISYNTTATMNSDKQFYFNVNNGTYKEMQPYETYLNCARSTEKMILNNSYAEYIKNGYNYDLWNQKRQEKIATINAVISGVQAAAGIALGGASTIPSVARSLSTVKRARYKNEAATNARNIATYNFLTYNTFPIDGASDIPIAADVESAMGYYGPASKLNDANNRLNEARAEESKARSDLSNSITGVGALVINNGINAINSMVNSAASIESSKRSFSNAVNSRANTPIAASGNVPTDLFDNYSSNKLTRYEYTIRPEDRTNLFNTFRLTGYAHPVQEKPVFNTRIYSNFVQCKPVFLNSATEIYKVYLDDISLRFQAGVTVKHNYKGKYDLYDQYENYETIVMEEE